jgi:hypothetical protein
VSPVAIDDRRRLDGPAYGPWADPGRRARVAVGCLMIVVYWLVVDVLWTVVGIATVGGLVAAPSDAWFGAYDTITMVIAWLYLAALAVSAATFIRWQRAAIRNLAFLGCERPEIGPGFATAGWFIPIASLVVPLLSLREIARWSRPPDARSAGALLGWWWGGWVAASLTVSAASAAFSFGTEVPVWLAAATIDAVGTLGLVATGVLAIKTVRTVTGWQRRSREARGLPAPGRPAPPGSGAGSPSELPTDSPGHRENPLGGAPPSREEHHVVHRDGVGRGGAGEHDVVDGWIRDVGPPALEPSQDVDPEADIAEDRG